MTKNVTTLTPADAALLAPLGDPPRAYFQAWQKYDVIQSKNGPAERPWLDYSTIKDEEDARLAALHVKRGETHDGRKIEFRIVRQVPGVGLTVILDNESCRAAYGLPMQLIEIRTNCGPFLHISGQLTLARLLTITAILANANIDDTEIGIRLDAIRVRGGWDSDPNENPRAEWTGFDYEEQAWIKVQRRGGAL